MGDRQDRKRWGLDLVPVDAPNLRHGINDAANRLIVNVHHDRSGFIVYFSGQQAKPFTQVDDWNYRSAQIDQPLDEIRHLGNPRNGLHQDDFLDLGDGGRIILLVQSEAHKLNHRVVTTASSTVCRWNWSSPSEHSGKP